MKTFILLLSASALIVLAAGCASSGVSKSATTDKAGGMERFVALDAGAKHSVACTGIQEGRTPDGRFKVVANLHNNENRRIEVQAGCVFKDDQGFAVDETPFRTVFLDEHATESVAFESFKTDTTNYTVRVRQAR